MYDCYVRTRILSALLTIDDPDAIELAQEDIDRKIWLWDHGAGFDYAHSNGASADSDEKIATYLQGLWPAVAILDPIERSHLLTALNIGSLAQYPIDQHPFSRNVYIRESRDSGNLSFPQNPALANFVKSLGQRNFLQRYDRPNDQRAFSH